MMKDLIVIRNNLNDLIFNNFIINNDSEFLYHYTDLYSAKLIIESGHFWVSDAFTTTDDEEIIHVKNIINRIINDKYSFLENEKMKQCSDFFQYACDTAKTNAFILCFSFVKDSKPLWKKYEKDNNKIGVCLRFDFNKITPNLVSELFSQERYFVDTKGNDIKIQLRILNRFVTYNEITIYKKIEEYMNIVYKTINRIPIDYTDDKLYKDEINLLVDIFSDILFFAFFSKVSGWKDEREYRMLYFFPDISKFPLILKSRMRKNKTVNYVATNMKTNNTFSLNRIFVSSKKDIRVVKKELKPYIGDDIKIKSI